jgi:flagellar basal body rod protein FlgF
MILARGGFKETRNLPIRIGENHMQAIQAGLEGLQRAEASLDRAAQRIARAPLSAVSGGNAPQDTIDLSQDMITLLQARYHYKANLKAIETAEEMQTSTLDILG